MGKYDTVIIGAGPAGSTTANVLATKGYETLLIDRRRKIGLPVQCGELLPTPDEITKLFPKSKRGRDLVNIPEHIISNKTCTISTIAPDGSKFSFPFEMHVIDREAYDEYLVQKAIDAGSRFHGYTSFEGFKSNHELDIRFPSERRRIEARSIVGADGPTSTVADELHLAYHHNPQKMSHSMQYILTNTTFDEDEVLMFFGNQAAPGGYAWVIPKGDGVANIGLGLRRSYSQSGISLRSYLNHLLKKNPQVIPYISGAKIRSRVSALIPVGGPIPLSYHKNIILVGDAAGHVMASNGGGIPTALIGGQIAGESIDRYLAHGVSLKSYEETWKQEMGTELFTALAILRVADRLMQSDTLTKTAMRLVGRSGLEAVVRCKLPDPISFLTPLAAYLSTYL